MEIQPGRDGSMIQFPSVALNCMNTFDICMSNLSQEMSGFKPFRIQCISSNVWIDVWRFCRVSLVLLSARVLDNPIIFATNPLKAKEQGKKKQFKKSL